ncbi:hypothetical protein [Candidatus Phytoplasma australiense]|uniref:hypothetical protein n=1 Tax=Phytoplasma australiense TaxID=59748 RepID=UPI0005A17B5F|nr:hypothetical protein [Candidatus Phytoplasma australiense]
MKLKILNKTVLISTIFFIIIFLNPLEIHASPNNNTLKRCNAFKYDENNNIVSVSTPQIIQNLNTISILNINKTKFFHFLHKIFHCGIDILSITNEIIDLQNN